MTAAGFLFLLWRVLAPGGWTLPKALLLIAFIGIFAVLTFLTVLVLAPFAEALSSRLIS